MSMANAEYTVAQQRGNIPTIKLRIEHFGDPGVTSSKDDLAEKLIYKFNPDDTGWSAGIFYGNKRGNNIEMTVDLDTQLARCGTIYRHGQKRIIEFNPLFEWHPILSVNAQESRRGGYSGDSGVSALFEGKDLTGGVLLRQPVQDALLAAAKKWNVNYSSELKGEFVCFEDPALARIRIFVDEKLRYRNYWVELPAFQMKVHNDQGDSATVTIPAVEEH
jgi:hypothetical protein